MRIKITEEITIETDGKTEKELRRMHSYYDGLGYRDAAKKILDQIGKEKPKTKIKAEKKEENSGNQDEDK